jgi:hypothetical protein
MTAIHGPGTAELLERRAPFPLFQPGFVVVASPPGRRRDSVPKKMARVSPKTTACAAYCPCEAIVKVRTVAAATNQAVCFIQELRGENA